MEAFSHMKDMYELPTINLSCHIDRIPAELKEQRQWLNWRPEWRAEKGAYAKIPTDPATGRAMSPTNPSLWRSFENVIATAGEQCGVGYSFSADDPYVGFDIDGCIDQAGVIHPAVQGLMTQYPTYWEKSPSGTGIHGLFLDLLPPGLGCKAILPGTALRIELYAAKRYFTITGKRLGDGEIAPIPSEVVTFFPQDEDEATHEEKASHRRENGLDGAACQRYLARVTGALSADVELARLWAGDLSGYSEDHSAADLALCLKLAFYCECNAAAVNYCFRLSKLMREKWDEIHYVNGDTYGERTVTKAIKRYRTPTLSGASIDTDTLTAAVTVQANGTGQSTGHSGGAPSQPGGFKVHMATELMNKSLPEVKWAIEGLLPEGVIILAGKPKIGKSWLCLGLALAVAAGDKALGKLPTDQGEVLYLALEDNERRIQDRLRALRGSESVPPGLGFVFAAPLLGHGLVEKLTQWMITHPSTRLVIIDTLGRVRPGTKAGANLYQEDYKITAGLQALAAECHVTVFVTHHTRKEDSSDPQDRVSGTTGLTGGVDGSLVLSRDRGKNLATLAIAGRDIVDDQPLTLEFQGGQWVLQSQAPKVQITKERAEILDLLAKDGRMSAAIIARKLDQLSDTIRKRLGGMVKVDLIIKYPDATYGLPEKEEIWSELPWTPTPSKDFIPPSRYPKS